jgi:hypothetical protein
MKSIQVIKLWTNPDKSRERRCGKTADENLDDSVTKRNT